MSTSRKTLIVGGLTVLEAGCLLGVACLGRGLLPLERAAADAAPSALEAPPTEVRSGVLEAPETEVARPTERLAIPRESADVAPRSSAASRRDPVKESEFYSSFLAIAAREPDSLERIARGALGESGPDCRKVAALRVLCDTGSAAADDVLVSAVLELPDVPSGDAESVAGFALRRLSGRATTRVEARRGLEQLVFGPSRPSARLRAAAAAALCSSAPEADVWRIAERLRGETDELVLACAGAALSRNPNARAVEEARTSLGLPEAPVAETAEREE